MSSSTLDIELDGYHHHWSDHCANIVLRDEEGLLYRVSSHFLGMHIASFAAEPIETNVPGENLQALLRFVHSQFSLTSPDHHVMIKHTFPIPLAGASQAKLYVFCRMYHFNTIIAFLENNLDLWFNWCILAIGNLFEIAGNHKDVGLVQVGLKLLPHAKMSAFDYDQKANELPPEWQRAFLMCLVKGDMSCEGEVGFAKETDPKVMAERFGRYIEVSVIPAMYSHEIRLTTVDEKPMSMKRC